MEAEAKVEPGTPPVSCTFTGYLDDDGQIVIETDSDDCRRMVVEAGTELGVKVECKPCKAAASKFVAAMQARKLAKEAAPVTEPEPEPAPEPAA
ncbi:unnamed protein product [marine sediment metagenome]|uniref:Uncharacterized protein n=1 Tax=marine sediment metagenome TaxID=412755 RepID=X1TET8_9ZZZZ